jgi:predicted lipoprotein with Yx(FWY)xxD motif
MDESVSGENRIRAMSVPLPVGRADAAGTQRNIHRRKVAVMKLRTVLALPVAVIAAGLVLSACGQSTQIPGAATVSAAAAVATVPQSVAGAANKQVETAPPVALAEVGTFGEVLVGANGLTVYGFTQDVDGVSTCFDACAAAWPAVTVTDGFSLPEGIDRTLVSSIDRPDGSKQLKVGKWPLYFYAGDGAPGEANGQGVGGVWFVQAADGSLVKGDDSAADPAPTPAAPTPAADGPVASDTTTAAGDPVPASGPVVDLADVGALGDVMVGANGHTLYAFTKDPAGESTCFDACAQAWPPLTVEDGFTISDDLTASGVSTIDRPDGTRQLVMGTWALYYYAGDGAPGEANGQGVGGVWFAIDASCTLVKAAA